MLPVPTRPDFLGYWRLKVRTTPIVGLRGALSFLLEPYLLRAALCVVLTLARISQGKLSIPPDKPY